MMYGYYGGPVGNMFFGGFFMILFWVALIAFIIWIVRGGTVERQGERRKSRALDILEERYAKGEIDKVEFEAKKKDLL